MGWSIARADSGSVASEKRVSATPNGIHSYSKTSKAHPVVGSRTQGGRFDDVANPPPTAET